MAGALGWLWQTIGNPDGRIWLRRSLEASSSEDRYRSRACDWLGWMEINLGNYAAAEAPLRAGMEIPEELGDKAGTARPTPAWLRRFECRATTEAGFGWPSRASRRRGRPAIAGSGEERSPRCGPFTPTKATPD